MNRTSMHEPLETKRMIVREFIDLIQTIPDDEEQATVQKFLRYLQSLLRIKQVVPPVVEIMTVVKHTKPVLFHAARPNRFKIKQSVHAVPAGHELPAGSRALRRLSEVTFILHPGFRD